MLLLCCCCCPAAIRDPAEAWQRHIEDSLALLPVIEQYAASSSSSSSSLSLIDVGTGAGLPGMVLAVVRPDWQVGMGVWGSKPGCGPDHVTVSVTAL